MGSRARRFRQDTRYKPVAALSRHGDDRAVHAARDRLTGEEVVIKTSTLPLAAQEARALLALPPQCAPRLLDAWWRPDEGLHLVLERLAGRTLLAAAPELAPGDLPPLVASLARQLSAVHRMGLVHCDLKPANVFLLPRAGWPDVRLLDFGFAHSRTLDLPGELGGTPPFMSPELARGWAIDGRADQYSLGMTLKALFPDLTRDARWTPILARLCETVPARRFPHMSAVRAAIIAAFELAAPAAPLPALGAGSLRGREEVRRALLARIRTRTAARLVLAARPGTGLTRFMLELVLEVAAEAGPPLRMLDLNALRDVPGERIAAFITEHTRAGEALLVGAPDPSPRWRAVEAQWGSELREALRETSWERDRLAPIDAAAVAEIVTESLGAGGAAPEALGAALHAQTEGDLHAAAEGFAAVLARCAAEEQGSWKIDEEQFPAALAAWRSPALEPTLRSVPQDLREPLQILARAGFDLPRTVAAKLLAEFASAAHLTALLDEGYLQPGEEGRFQLITRSLAREANTLAGERAQRIDRWLLEHWTPDPARAEEVLAAARRARAAGDSHAERRFLAAGLKHAHHIRAWDALRRYYDYPDEICGEWSLERAHHSAKNLRAILGDEWSEGQLLFILAEGLRPTEPQIANQIFDEVVAMEADPASRDALVVILDRSVSRSDWKAYDHWREIHAARALQGGGVHPGILGFCEARRALSEGRVDVGIARAEEAAAALRDSGSVFEGLTLQLLAFLRLSRDRAAGLATMRAAYEAAQDRDLKAQMCKNLALMHSQRGDFSAAAACAEEGLCKLQGSVSAGRLAALRLERAVAWANLGKLAAALREGRTLLTLTSVRQVRSYEVSARLLLAYCHLYQHTSRRALAHAARAWQMSAEGCFPGLRTYCLRTLIDVLLDLEAWDAVAAVDQELLPAVVGPSPADATTAARATALLHQARGEFQPALAALEEKYEQGRTLPEPEAAGRYLHHLGWVQLACGEDAPAAESFTAERALLSATGYHYYRGRAAWALARTLYAAGEKSRAGDVLDEAIAQAEEADCRGLLAQCLLLRAEHELAE